MPSFLVPDDAQLHWMNYLKGGTLPGKLEVGSPKSYVSIPIGFSLGLLLAFGLRLENQGGARVRVREPDLGRAARHRIGISLANVERLRVVRHDLMDELAELTARIPGDVPVFLLNLRERSAESASCGGVE